MLVNVSVNVSVSVCVVVNVVIGVVAISHTWISENYFLYNFYN